SSGAVVAGPGLGQSRHAHDALARALASKLPTVLDADALNLIAAEPALQQKTRLRRAPTLLTPHPLEAARLLGTSAASIQSDRLGAARELAAFFLSTVILKGSGTVIADHDGQLVINTTGNPALATAGTGDVLSGLCGALLAQHWPVWEAALAAVWLHGAAADKMVSEGTGPRGLTAGELLTNIRSLLNQLDRG
ncbi:MAG: NAD(P)H-hydrate dehydratase, partial [Myxococcales bacterium]|nr:NAD(P)H-hydrate dehydratase [Myxococcales bacterium]